MTPPAAGCRRRLRSSSVSAAPTTSITAGPSGSLVFRIARIVPRLLRRRPRALEPVYEAQKLSRVAGLREVSVETRLLGQFPVGRLLPYARNRDHERPAHIGEPKPDRLGDRVPAHSR